MLFKKSDGMGVVNSKDTRRISFENTVAICPSLAIKKSIEDDSIIDLASALNTDQEDDLILNENIKIIEPREEGEPDYWVQRVQHLKNEHQSINKIIEVEYDKTIKNINNIYETPKITHEKIQKMKPCFEWRSKILKCYEDNPHQPLVCFATVQAFSKYVESCTLEK